MTATCTWGDGPDVLLSLDNTKMTLLTDLMFDGSSIHGAVDKGLIDLTAQEARELASQLIMAADEADSLVAICEEHDRAVENDKLTP